MAIPPVASSLAAILSCGFRQIKGIAAAERAMPRPKAQKNDEFFAAG
jgi:hypothetical protein